MNILENIEKFATLDHDDRQRMIETLKQVAEVGEEDPTAHLQLAKKIIDELENLKKRDP